MTVVSASTHTGTSVNRGYWDFPLHRLQNFFRLPTMSAEQVLHVLEDILLKRQLPLFLQLDDFPTIAMH
jgi:hypothetical protein